MKVCNSLNRSCDVRDVARDTLIKMATALGSMYLQYLIKEMKELLTRGYQVIVINLTLSPPYFTVCVYSHPVKMQEYVSPLQSGQCLYTNTVA